MADPRAFGVDPAELSRKLSHWLVSRESPYRACHTTIALDQGAFTDAELVYLITVATETLISAGVKP